MSKQEILENAKIYFSCDGTSELLERLLLAQFPHFASNYSQELTNLEFAQKYILELKKEGKKITRYALQKHLTSNGFKMLNNYKAVELLESTNTKA
jgi:hypothetical protein